MNVKEPQHKTECKHYSVCSGFIHFTDVQALPEELKYFLMPPRRPLYGTGRSHPSISVSGSLGTAVMFYLDAVSSFCYLAF